MSWPPHPYTPKQKHVTIELPEPNNTTVAWDSFDHEVCQYAGNPKWVTLGATWRGPSYHLVSLQGGTGYFTVGDAEQHAAAILAVCARVREYLDRFPDKAPTPHEYTLMDVAGEPQPRMKLPSMYEMRTHVEETTDQDHSLSHKHYVALEREILRLHDGITALAEKYGGEVSDDLLGLRDAREHS